MKTFLRRLLRVAFYGALALIAFWWFGLEGASPQQLFSTPPAPIPFPNAFLRLVSIDVDQRPLDDVLRELSIRHGVSIQVDPAALQNTALTGEELVSLKVDGIPLYGVLSLLTSNLGTKRLSPIVRVKDRVVAYVTTEDVWYSTPLNFETRVYPLDALLTAPSAFHESSLGNAIASTIEQSSWADKSKGSLGVWEPVPGALVVVQTPDVHEQIQRLFDYLQRQADGEVGFTPVDISDPCHAENAILREKLRKRINVDFSKKPFADVIEEFSKKYELPLVIDSEMAATQLQSQLTFCLNDISLLSVLNLICADLDVFLDVHEGAVLISNQYRGMTRSRYLWRTKTIAQSGLDLQSLPGFDWFELRTWLSQVTKETSLAAWDGQLSFDETGRDMPHVETCLAIVRQGAFPYAVSESATTSHVPIAVQHASDVKLVWGGNESIRSLGVRLADELGTNVWIDAHRLRWQEKVDADLEQSWPDKTTTIDQYFRRNDLPENLVAIVRDDAIVLTTSDRALRYVLSTHVLGHWLGNENADGNWEVIKGNILQTKFLADFRSQDMVVVGHDWRGSTAHRDMLNIMSCTRWPPRGVLHSWNDATGAASLCAFDMGPVLNGLQAIAAQRMTDSPTWAFGALVFATAPRPINLFPRVPLQGKTLIADHLKSALDAVISLTLPTHSDGVTFTLLDDTAIAVIGPDDPARVTSILDALTRQLKHPVNGVDAMRLDTWNDNGRPGNTAAFLYDVRALLAAHSALDEHKLRRLIDTVMPPSIVKKYQYDAADVEVLPGFLIVIHDLETQRSLAKLFRYLHSDPVGQVIQNLNFSADDSLSASITTQNPNWLARVIDDLRQDDDPVRNNFRMWVLGQANIDLPEVTSSLVTQLERTIAMDNPRGCYLAVDALTRRKSETNRVLPLLRQAFAQPWESESRASLIELLSKFGRPAIPLMVELLESEDLLVQDTARRSLAEFGADAVPDLLEWFDRTRHKEAHLALDAVDPILTTTRNTLVGWEKSGVPELTARAARLRKLLQEHGFEIGN